MKLGTRMERVPTVSPFRIPDIQDMKLPASALAGLVAKRRLRD